MHIVKFLLVTGILLLCTGCLDKYLLGKPLGLHQNACFYEPFPVALQGIIKKVRAEVPPDSPEDKPVRGIYILELTKPIDVIPHNDSKKYCYHLWEKNVRRLQMYFSSREEDDCYEACKAREGKLVVVCGSLTHSMWDQEPTRVAIEVKGIQDVTVTPPTNAPNGT